MGFTRRLVMAALLVAACTPLAQPSEPSPLPVPGSTEGVCDSSLGLCVPNVGASVVPNSGGAGISSNDASSRIRSACSHQDLSAVPTVVSALRDHGHLVDVADAGASCLRNLAVNPSYQVALMPSVPVVLEVLDRHISNLPVVEASLGFLRNVATNGANQKGLLYVVPAVGRALTQAPGANSAIAAEHGLACLLNVAVDDENKERMVEHVPLIMKVLERHAGAPMAVRHGMGCLRNIVVQPASKEPLMEVLPAVLRALERHSTDVPMVEHAFGFVRSMAVLEANRPELLRTAVPVVMRVLARVQGTATAVEPAQAFIWNLIVSPENAEPLKAVWPALKAAGERHPFNTLVQEWATKLKGKLAP